MEGLQITHTVYSGDLRSAIDLRYVALHSRDIVYENKHFKRLVWSHKRIRGTMMIYRGGKTIFHTNNPGPAAIKQYRAYCRLLQKLGIPVLYTRPRVVTMSAKYKLENTVIDYNKFAAALGISYTAEIYHALQWKRGKCAFTLYSNAVLIITGLKGPNDAETIVWPCILELLLM